MHLNLSKLAIWLAQAATALYWNSAAAISAHAFVTAERMWGVFGLYWLISAARHRAVKKTERWFAQLSHILPMALAFALAFQPHTSVGPLGLRLVPESASKDVVGLLLTAVGIALAIWARVHLGMNWSASVTIRSEHELIGSGPYRYVRHPIYTGIIIGLAGTALIVGEARALLGLAIAVVSFYFKAHKEETWLTREFGTQFDAHFKQKGMFFPRIAAH